MPRPPAIPNDADASVATVSRSALQALQRLAANLAVDLEPAAIGQLLLETLAGVMGAGSGRVVLVDGDELAVTGTLGILPEDGPGRPRYPIDGPIPGAAAVRTRAMVVVPDAATFRERFPAAAERFAAAGAQACVSAPLIFGERTLGAITMGFHASRAFVPDELELIQAVAATGAQAMERARLRRVERQARGMLDAVVAQMPVGVAVTDAVGGVLYRNAALETIWHGDRHAERVEGSAERVDGYAERRGFHADGRPYAAADWPGARCLSGEIVTDEEIAILRSDGSSGTLSVSGAPVRDTDGAIVAGVVVVVDISQRKAAESVRDAFVGVLSHELRTPVTAIYGGAKVLASRVDLLDRQTRDGLIADIAAESERLNRLVEDLLVLAKVERGVELRAEEPILVQHRLRAVVAALRGEWPDRRFVCEIPDRVPPVRGEEGYLEQVLRNLLGNAAKYGHGEVVARVEVREGEVLVSVLDDGPGIAAGDADRLFDLFYRGLAGTRAPGAGIGLFVASRLVDAMGGRLWGENRPEGGAAFRFTLPRMDDERTPEVESAGR